MSLIMNQYIIVLIVYRIVSKIEELLDAGIIS